MKIIMKFVKLRDVYKVYILYRNLFDKLLHNFLVMLNCWNSSLAILTVLRLAFCEVRVTVIHNCLAHITSRTVFPLIIVAASF